MKNIKHILLTILVILSLSKDRQCFAQTFSKEEQHQIDSLNAIINNPASHDTVVIMTYLEIANYYYLKNPDTAIIICKKAETLSENIDYTKGKGHSYGWLGYLIDNQGNIPEALEYYHKSLSIQEEIGDKSVIITSLNNIGCVYTNQGDIPKALEYFHKSLKINEEISDKQGIAYSLNNIGSIYNNQGDIPKALEYYLKSLTINEEIGDKKGIAYSLNNIGYIYNNQGDVPKALEYYHKSLTIREEIGDKQGIAYSLNNIGMIYNNQDDIPKALEYYLKSLTIQEEIGDKQGIATSLLNLGEIYKKQGDTPKALEYGTKSLRLAQELGYPDLIAKSSKLLSSIARKQGNYKEALEMFELYTTMQDSINNEETQKAAAHQQAKYEYEKQKAVDEIAHQKEKEILDANIQKQELEIKTKKQQQYYLCGGLGLLAIFGLFMFNRFRVTQKQKGVIETQKTAVEHQKEELQVVHEQLEEHHKEITDSINYAERIQRSFLATKDMLDVNLKDYFVFFKPKDVVSGDFYWAGHLHNGNFAVVNADSTGHGVPGAIMSILNISSIEKAIEQGENEPSKIFNQTRKTIIERLKKDGSEHGGKDGMDASIVCFDFEQNKFTYAAANNPIWVIRKGSPLKKGARGIDDSASENEIAGQARNDEREIIILKPDKMPVGKHDNDSDSFSQGMFEFEKGDQIYTLTDGFQDQFGGPKGKKFMVKKMREYILSIAHLPMKEQHEKLNEVFTNWKGEHEQVDDVCVIGVKI